LFQGGYRLREIISAVERNREAVEISPPLPTGAESHDAFSDEAEQEGLPERYSKLSSVISIASDRPFDIARERPLTVQLQARG